MKNFAGLALFFSICFAVLFLLSGLFRFLALWIDAVREVPPAGELSGSFITAMGEALAMTVYITILLALSYTARGKMSALFSITAVVVLAAVFTLGASLGVRQLQKFEFALNTVPPVRARPGLILSRGGTAVVLLTDSSAAGGPQVVSLPDRPLIYREAAAGPADTVSALPALPFDTGTAWVVRSVLIDFRLSAVELASRLDQGLPAFAVYGGALILLLSSLRFLLELSNWPLANLFQGAMAFRGILALEIFLNARETRVLVSSFFGNRLPVSLITPLAFCALAVLVVLYTFLASLAGGKRGGNA
jgi:hypothetical protein